MVTRKRIKLHVGLSPTSNVDMGAVVDPAFIQDVEHRSKLSMTVDESIPTIDLSDSREDIPSLVMEIGKACKEWGFFQVINHGVPSEKRARLDAAARRFFALPLEEKRKVRRDETKVIGYYDTGHTRNVRDWKEVFDVTVHDPTYAPASYDPEDREITQWWNQWPENPPELREACEDYIEEMEKLAFRLMGLIVLSLGLSGERFRSFFEGHTSFMRLNHYPPCPDPRLALGISGHKDSGVLTILAQDDVSGLEVKRKRDGEWILVRPAQDVLIINIGDVIQVWSNEAYESAEHRAILNPDRDRLSVPFFFFPGHHVMVEPLKELCGRGVGGREAVYRPYNWGKFLATRKRSNFMKLDVDNIQIRHFKLNA